MSKSATITCPGCQASLKIAVVDDEITVIGHTPKKDDGNGDNKNKAPKDDKSQKGDRQESALKRMLTGSDEDDDNE